MDVQCSTEVGLCDISYVKLLWNLKLSTIELFKRQATENV